MIGGFLRMSLGRFCTLVRRVEARSLAFGQCVRTSVTTASTARKLVQLEHLESKIEETSLADLTQWMDTLGPSQRQKIAESLISSFDHHKREDIAQVFKQVDVNKDGLISRSEFAHWYAVHAKSTGNPAAASSSEPTNKQLFHLALAHGVPMVGFGFCDNFIMIIAGESIDSTLGATLHLSTMAAAGLGNMFSDVVGLSLSNSIEAASHRLGLPDPKLTAAQRKHRRARFFRTFASIVGITIGCLLGMVPLLFSDNAKKDARELFGDLDLDNDGRINWKSLRRALRRMDFVIDEDALERVLLNNGMTKESLLQFEQFWKIVQKLKADPTVQNTDD